MYGSTEVIPYESTLYFRTSHCFTCRAVGPTVQDRSTRTRSPIIINEFACVIDSMPKVYNYSSCRLVFSEVSRLSQQGNYSAAWEEVVHNFWNLTRHDRKKKRNAQTPQVPSICLFYISRRPNCADGPQSTSGIFTTPGFRGLLDGEPENSKRCHHRRWRLHRFKTTRKYGQFRRV